MVVSSGMCDAIGGLDKSSFLILIKTQMRQHVMKQVVASMAVADPVQQAILAVMKLTLSHIDPANRYLRTEHTCCMETALRLCKSEAQHSASAPLQRANAQNQRGAEGGEAARGGGFDTGSLGSCSDADDDTVDIGDMRNSYLQQRIPTTQSMLSKYKSKMKLDVDISPSLRHVESVYGEFGQGAMGSAGDRFERQCAIKIVPFKGGPIRRATGAAFQLSKVAG